MDLAEMEQLKQFELVVYLPRFLLRQWTPLLLIHPSFPLMLLSLALSNSSVISLFFFRKEFRPDLTATG